MDEVRLGDGVLIDKIATVIYQGAECAVPLALRDWFEANSLTVVQSSCERSVLMTSC